MAKNIIILLDGTSNEIETNRTNILRLYGVLEKAPDQIVYYDPGVGTMGGAKSWLRVFRKMSEIWGLATGWGLDQNVKEAYRFLVENYEHDDGDKIFLFGYSRGAYTARVLAGLIHIIGIINKRNLNLLDYAYRAYKRAAEDPEKRSDKSLREIGLYKKVLDTPETSIEFIGLFDTVASVIESGRFGVRFRRHAFSSRNPSVHHVRHALAMHERRSMFQHMHWKKTADQDVKEVWFYGTHGDVGGGQPEEESRLAKIPLVWMIDEAKKVDLKFRQKIIDKIVLGREDPKEYVGPSFLGQLHNQVAFLWKLLELLPRRMKSNYKGAHILRWTIPLYRYRTINDGARVHETVLKRQRSNGETVPNLPQRYVLEVEKNL